MTSVVCTIFTLIGVCAAGSLNQFNFVPKGICPLCSEIYEKADIKFMLYTRKKQNSFETLYINDAKRLRRSNFNFNYPLAVYFHGFSESGEAESSQEIKRAFLKSGDYNVILVDWSTLSGSPWYVNAVNNLPIAGKYVARFISFLLKQGYQVQKIHLIGFSLGAEMAGFVGKHLKKSGILLPRITGLDPALPLFEDGSSNQRLSRECAQFVDIIHTDGDMFGNAKAMGHVDFYPNGGHALQPGCVEEEVDNLNLLGIIFGCSHRRAWQFFKESILRPFAFPAKKCKPSDLYNLFGSCRGGKGKAFMGMGADKSVRGTFFLETNAEPPFGKNTF